VRALRPPIGLLPPSSPGAVDVPGLLHGGDAGFFAGLLFVTKELELAAILWRIQPRALSMRLRAYPVSLRAPVSPCARSAAQMANSIPGRVPLWGSALRPNSQP